MRYKAEIHVTLKRTVNDPQGLAIRGGLHSLGYEGIETVRAGKYIEVWLEAESAEQAQRLANKMSDQLLANPVIEDYTVTITEPAPPPAPTSPPVPSPSGRGLG